jgi:hypothetical protein
VAGEGREPGSRKGPGRSGELEALKERYRTILVDKLTPEDLGELQSYLGKQFDDEGNLDRVYKEKFEEKLRGYLHEEVLTREIASIEALIRGLKPSDLKRASARRP